MKKVTNTWIYLLIGSLAVLLVLISANSYRGVSQIEGARKPARASSQLVKLVEQLYSRVVDAETGQRGYVITGEDAYLTPYFNALREMTSLRAQIDEMVPQASADQELFRQLFEAINEKLAELDQSIEVRREQGFEEAKQVVMSNNGQRVMEQVRSLIDRINEIEVERFNTRVQVLTMSFQTARRGIIFSSLLGLLACGMVLVLVNRALRIRQRASQLILQEQENLRVTLESIGDGVIATNERGEVTMLNPVAQELTKWTLEEALGRPSTDVFHIVNEDSGEVVESPVTRVLREGVIVGLANHTVLIAKDGTRRPISDSGAPIRRGNKIVGAIMVFRDMSDQRQAEKEYERYVAEVHREQLRLKSVIEAMPVGVVLADADGKLSQFNNEFRKIWGEPPQTESISEYEAWKAWWPNTGEQVKPEEFALARSLQNGEICRGEVMLIESFDGKQRTIINSSSPLYDGDGKLMGGVVAEIDITEQAQVRESLADAQSRLESLLEIGEIGTWDWDIQKNKVVADRNLAKMFSIDIKQAAGGPLDAYIERIHPDDRSVVQEAIEAAMRHHESFTAEYRLVDEEGEISWLSARARIERDESGHAIRMPGVVIDMTERRLLEDNLRKLASDLSIADQRKNDFIATLAHELRNPLAPIRTGIETLKWHNQDESNTQVIETMERQVRQMVRLIEDLLDISRITRGSLSLRRQPCEITEILNNAIESTSSHFEERSQTFHAELPTSEVCVDADAARLTQVVANLLDNSAKYTPHNGEIWLKAWEENEKLFISVRDNGFGIDPDMQDHIFQMFGQIKQSLEDGYSGLGIGLTLVKTIVEMHDGAIEVYSAGLNQGSEFLISLPTCDLPEVPFVKPSQFDEIQESDRALRVLVVDDNRAAAKMLKLMIEKLGHQVEMAHDGLEGIESAKTFHPHLILMDIGMPRLNGYEATRRIHAEDWGKEIVIAALSGWGHEDDKRRTQEAGFDYHLVKPAELSALNEILNSVTNSHIDSEDDTLERKAVSVTVSKNGESHGDVQSSNAAVEDVRKLAHDIKTPLSVIVMGLDVLKQNAAVNEDTKMVCEMMDTDGIKPLEVLVGQLVEELKKQVARGS